MSRLNEYCNITTDLQDVVKNIESYAYQMIDNNLFESVAGQVYSQLGQVGNVGQLYIDRLAESIATSASAIDSSTTWYYDSTLDVLYVFTSSIGSNELSIASGTWSAIKTRAREDASQSLENYLYMYNAPLPFRRNSNQEYDRDIKRACAILTCINIVEQDNPNNLMLESLNSMVYDPVNEKGIIYDYLHGRKHFSFEGTTTTFNGLITPNTLGGSGNIELAGENKGWNYHVYEILISTAGAVETAKFQLTEDGTVVGTFTTTHNYMSIGDGGTYVRFYGTFVENDKWTIEYDGRAKSATKTGARSIRQRA